MASDLVTRPPTRDLGPAADAYVAIVQALEAAERNRFTVAIGLGTPGNGQLSAVNQWVNSSHGSHRIAKAGPGCQQLHLDRIAGMIWSL